MKKKPNKYTSIVLLLTLLFTACDKEYYQDNPAPVNPAPPLPGRNPPSTGGGTAVVINGSAGGYYTVMIPEDSFYLHGNINPPDVAPQWEWKTISGPNTPVILSPDKKSTKVGNVVPGKYVFELTVSLPSYSSDTDTVYVEVLKFAQVPGNEIIISNIDWVVYDAWDFWILTVNNIFSLLPAGTAFKVYVQRGSADWLLISNFYQSSIFWPELTKTYFIRDGNLEILFTENNILGRPKIKIVY